MTGTRRVCFSLAALCTVPTSGLAEPSLADVERFNSCVATEYRANADNFTAALGVPVICGAKHIPYQTSCAFLRKLMAPEECIEGDFTYWKAETDKQLLAEGYDVAPAGSMLAAGLQRCADNGGGALRQKVCETEVYWRSAVIAKASPVIEAIQSETTDQ